jgi:hypothetical protein
MWEHVVSEFGCEFAAFAKTVGRATSECLYGKNLWGLCPPPFPAIQACVNMYISAVLKM